MRNNKNLVCIALFFSTSVLFSQVKITDSNNKSISENAILHLESKNNDKGLLLPRISLTSTSSSSPLSKHTNGMVIYNTNTVSGKYGVSPGMYISNGSNWVKLDTTVQNDNGDTKHSFIKQDHENWYLLDGRSISSLPKSAQEAAKNIGLTGNLPNAEGAYLVNKNKSEKLNTILGSNKFTINKENLPSNIGTLSGVTNAAGAHSHTFTDDSGVGRLNRFGRNTISPYRSTSRTTSSAGNHKHTFTASIGEGEAVKYVPSSIVTNIFIYLNN